MRSAYFGSHLLILIVLSASAAAAQENRMSMGLALEGGGAHGLAHIGVLKWMEEHRIPVDYIAGTSMGGLVGGAYATGLRPQEVEQILDQVDWPRTMSGTLPYEALAFRRKQDAREYPNRLEFGLKQGLRLPSGFNAGHEVGFILDRIALPYSSADNFDDLAIPFRCVAVELTSGREEVFSRGSLSLAMKATMSVPGFFSPVHSGGKIYVDGGLLDNLPVDVVREMGAQKVIAIHLEQAKLPPDTLLSQFQVLSWSVDAVTSSNERRSLAKADVAVTVDLQDINWDTFSAADEIIRRGYTAAERQAAQLLPFALTPDEWAEHLRAREQRRQAAATRVASIDVTGVSGINEALIRNGLREFEGQPLNQHKLQTTLTELLGTKRFHTLDYRLTTSSGTPVLLIIAREKDYAPPTLNLLFDVDGSDYNDVQFSIGGRVTFQDVWIPESEVRIDLAVGSVYGLVGEYYLPLSKNKRLFVAPSGGIRSVPFPVFAGAERVADFRLDSFSAGVDVGYAINRFSELRIGYEGSHLIFSRQVGSPVLPDLDGLRSGVRARYVLDKLDDPVVPQQGDAALGDFNWFDSNPGATEPFASTQLEYQLFRRFKGSITNSIFVIASGGTTFGRNDGGLPTFSLGGPFRLSAYSTNELLTNQYFLFRAGFTHRFVGMESLLGSRYYLFGMYEIGKAYGVPKQSRLPNDIAAGILAKTLLGPFVIGASYGDNGHRKLFFRIGRVF